jgi:drug/metabolite transporter (DMT)-like permease
VIAVALGWALLSEEVTSTVVVGGGVVVVAVAMVISAEWRRPLQTPAS